MPLGPLHREQLTQQLTVNVQAHRKLLCPPCLSRLRLSTCSFLSTSPSNPGRLRAAPRRPCRLEGLGASQVRSLGPAESSSMQGEVSGSPVSGDESGSALSWELSVTRLRGLQWGAHGRQSTQPGRHAEHAANVHLTARAAPELPARVELVVPSMASCCYSGVLLLLPLALSIASS